MGRPLVTVELVAYSTQHTAYSMAILEETAVVRVQEVMLDETASPDTPSGLPEAAPGVDAPASEGGTDGSAAPVRWQSWRVALVALLLACLLCL